MNTAVLFVFAFVGSLLAKLTRIPSGEGAGFDKYRLNVKISPGFIEIVAGITMSIIEAGALERVSKRFVSSSRAGNDELEGCPKAQLASNRDSSDISGRLILCLTIFSPHAGQSLPG